MQIRTFTVPFAKVVGDEATELDFGPDDYLVVRPIFGLSKTDLESWQKRFAELQTAVDKTPTKAQATADQLALDLLNTFVLQWHLDGPDGPIAKPGTIAALNALPGALAGSLLAFLAGFRGEGANPTTSS